MTATASGSAKSGSLTRKAIRLGRPAELAQDRRGIEDVAARRFWPFAVHKTGEMRLVELAESCAPGVHQMNAGVAGPRRERLDPDRAADQRRNHIAHGQVSKRAHPSRKAGRCRGSRLERGARVTRCRHHSHAPQKVSRDAGVRPPVPAIAAAQARAHEVTQDLAGAERRSRRPRSGSGRHDSRSRSSDSASPRYPASASARSRAGMSSTTNVVSGFSRTWPNSKCGERSRAMAGPRAKLALTHDSTRSTPRRALGRQGQRVEDVWQAIPADRITSRAT